jgi:hypothetical protein
MDASKSISPRCLGEASYDMKSAAEIATSYLAGRLSLFDTAHQLLPHIDAHRSALWQDLSGADGSLSVIYSVFDVAEQLGFFVPEDVRWEPEAFKSRQTQLS